MDRAPRPKPLRFLGWLEETCHPTHEAGTIHLVRNWYRRSIQLSYGVMRLQPGTYSRRMEAPNESDALVYTGHQ